MSHVAIPLFDGESYDLWAVRMQTYLEIMLVRRCFTNDYDQDHDSKVSQRNLGILESIIWREREDSRHESFELDNFEMQRMKELETIRILKQIVGYCQQDKIVGKRVSRFQTRWENSGDGAGKIWGIIYCFLRKYKRFVYNHLYRGDTCLTSTRTTKIDKRRSWGGWM